MAAALAAPRPSAWWRDPVLLAAAAALALLAAVFLAPRPVAAVSPPALSLVVADLRGHALLVVDTSTGGARRIPLPGGPHELETLPDGRLVVSLEQYGSLALVDPASGAVEAIPVGGIPHGLAVDGDTLYVTDRSTDAIRRFTVGSWAERAPITARAMPHIVAARQGGGLIVANAADDTLTLGDRALPVSAVPESVALGAGGVVATAGSVGGTLHLFDAAGASIAEWAVGGRPVRLQYDPHGRVLAVALSAQSAVGILQDDRWRRIMVGGVPDGLAFSPDGRWLYVGDMHGGAVSVIDVQRSRLVQRVPAGQSAGALLVLPQR